MTRMLIRMSIVALALMLPLGLAACGASDEEVVDPVVIEEEVEDVDATTDADDAEEPDVHGTGDVADLEGDVDGLEGFIGRSGFPDTVPVPAGVLESSEADRRRAETRYTLTIVNPSPVDSEAATDWYIDALEAAGFEVTSIVFERDSDGPSQRFMTIDAEIRAENEAGLQVRAYIRPEDETLAFGLDVREP